MIKKLFFNVTCLIFVLGLISLTGKEPTKGENQKPTKVFCGPHITAVNNSAFTTLAYIGYGSNGSEHYLTNLAAGNFSYLSDGAAGENEFQLHIETRHPAGRLRLMELNSSTGQYDILRFCMDIPANNTLYHYKIYTVYCADYQLIYDDSPC